MYDYLTYLGMYVLYIHMQYTLYTYIQREIYAEGSDVFLILILILILWLREPDIDSISFPCAFPHGVTYFFTDLSSDCLCLAEVLPRKSCRR